MCSDPVYPRGEVRSCYVGCTRGMWDIAHLVFIVTAGRYIGYLEQKNGFSSGGVLGAADSYALMIGTKSSSCFSSNE